MGIRKIGALIGAMAALAAGSVATVGTAFGDDNGTVAATVSVAAPCLTVSQTTPVDYGTLGFNNGASQSLGTVSNCSGGSSQSLLVRGTTATSASTTWELNGRNCAATPPTLNRYDHRLSLSTTGSSILSGRFLSTTDYQLETAMGPGATWDVTGMLQMPCSGSDGQGETFNFSVIFTAIF